MTTDYDIEKARAKKKRSSELADRLARLAAEILVLVDKHEPTPTSSHIRDQLLRAATAPGAHYAEARYAESTNDFVHKIALAAKECSETVHWLRVLEYAAPDGESVEDLIEEADELKAILHRSQQTARKQR